MLQAVVIEDAVIYPLTGSALAVNIFVLLGIPWDAGMEAQVCVVLYVDGAPIAAWGTSRSMRAFLNAAAFQWAAVFVGILFGVVPPRAHFVPSPAERMSGLVKSNVIRGISGGFCPAVDVDECIHIPMFQQFISRDRVRSPGRCFLVKAQKYCAQNHQWHRGSPCCHGGVHW